MNIKDFTDYTTFIGAVIAAIAGVWNLVIQMRGKRDNFLVRLGSLSPDMEPETKMCVVSRSDHPIRLIDWGFIESDGVFRSLIVEWEIGGLLSHEITQKGNFRLESFGQYYETGYQRIQIPMGAYAISATQRIPIITFDSGMPMWRRIWIRLRLFFQPSYLSW